MQHDKLFQSWDRLDFHWKGSISPTSTVALSGPLIPTSPSLYKMIVVCFPQINGQESDGVNSMICVFLPQIRSGCKAPRP